MKKDLLTRLNEGPIMCAEGYLFAMERRGYLSAGPFVPEVVLEHPEVVTQLHREFIRAGSDVVQAFTYYGHREKLRIIGKEHLLEPMQKGALKIAKDAAAEFKDLDLMVCGDVANTNVFDPREGHNAEDACKMMEDLGADVVGLNCYRGPEMTMKLLKKVREKVSCHVAGLPVPYRTTEEEPGFLNITDHGCNCIPGDNAFPVALDNLFCNRFEMAEFAKDCVQNKINFIGICCGAEAHHVREMSVAIGKKPISMKYMPDMSKHFHHGTDKSLKKVNKEIKY